MNEIKKKQIAILGSTGSIGTQALQVIEEHPELYEVYALTANNKVDLLIAQARKFMPEAVVIANEEKYAQLKEALSDLPVKVYAGAAALCQIVESGPIDVVLTAMVGYAGLKPTMNAIRAGKAIALANKETLVVAGELINQLARQYRTPILPVDSEHSAVFQCLAGDMEVNFTELLKKNPDTVGWIKVDGTKVNYPIVQAEDNDYYLSHAFNKRSNAGGWVFADYRVDFKDFGRNTIIYGHNMNNKTMFGSIGETARE